MNYRYKLTRAFDLMAMFRRIRYQARYYYGHVILPKLMDWGLVEPNSRDELTGALNRVSGLAHIRKNRREGKESLALLFTDFDRFIYFNDRNGFLAGDKVLKKFVTLVEPILKDEQFIFRYGGDEFVVALQNTSSDEALGLAQQIHDIVRDQLTPWQPENRIYPDSPPVKLTVSVGVAVSDDPEDTAESLLQKADIKMYEAKCAGGDRVCM